MAERRSITEAFVCDADCPRCTGDGIVCENHPERPWRETDDGCMCGAGMPCRPENRTAPEPDTLLGVMPVEAAG